MLNLDAIWRQCMDCAGMMIAGFSLLMVAFCGIAAVLAALGGIEREEAEDKTTAQVERADRDTRRVRLLTMPF